jgi:hypothetical protein
MRLDAQLAAHALSQRIRAAQKEKRNNCREPSYFSREHFYRSIREKSRNC